MVQKTSKYEVLVTPKLTKDIEIVLECVEYVGNQKFIANFGYDNPNPEEITIPDGNSILIFNQGQSMITLSIPSNPGVNPTYSARNFQQRTGYYGT